MARYYFDIDDGLRSTEDADGVDMDDKKAIRDAAIKVLPEIAWDSLPNGNDRVFSVNVRDETGRRIFQASLVLRSEWLA
jgi:hypothetical protein